MAAALLVLFPSAVLVSHVLRKNLVAHIRRQRLKESLNTSTVAREPQDTPQALLFSLLIPQELVEYLCTKHLDTEDVRNARLVCIEWSRGIPAKLVVRDAAVIIASEDTHGTLQHDYRCLASHALSAPGGHRVGDVHGSQTRAALPALNTLKITLPVEPEPSADAVRLLCKRISSSCFPASSIVSSNGSRGVVRASVHLDCNGTFVNLQQHHTAEVQDELILRSDAVWTSTNIIAQLPEQLQHLELTSDTCLPPAPLLTRLLERFTCLRSLKLGAGYGVVSEALAATAAPTIESLHISHLKWPDSKPATAAWELLFQQLGRLRSLTVEELSARDDGGFLHRGQADVHLAGVRASSPVTLLQGLHLLAGITPSRFPRLEALHLDPDSSQRLSSSQASWREAVAQLGSLPLLTSLRGLALVLRYDVTEAFDLLRAVSQLCSLHLELYSASYYEHQTRELDPLLAHMGRAMTQLQDVKVNCYKRRPIVLAQLASLAQLPPCTTSIDISVHHVAAAGSPAQLARLRNQLAGLRSLRLATYKVAEGLLLPGSCLPAGLEALWCDGGVVVQQQVQQQQKGGLDALDVEPDGSSSFISAEVVELDAAAISSSSRRSSKGHSSKSGRSKGLPSSSSSSSSSRPAVSMPSTPVHSVPSTPMGNSRAAFSVPSTPIGSSRGGFHSVPSTPLSIRTSSKPHLTLTPSSSSRNLSRVPAAVQQPLYRQLVRLYYTPLQAVHLAGLPLLRELTLCMDLHRQAAAPQLPISYSPALPSARPQQPQQVDPSKRTVHIHSLPPGLRKLSIISEAQPAGLQLRVVATAGLAPGSCAVLSELEISCAGDYKQLMLAAPHVEQLKVVFRQRNWQPRDAAALLQHAPAACLRALKLAMCSETFARQPHAAVRLEALLLALLQRCRSLRSLKLRAVSLDALQLLLHSSSTSPYAGSDEATSSSEDYSEEEGSHSERERSSSSSSSASSSGLAATLRELWLGELLAVQRPRLRGGGLRGLVAALLRRRRAVVSEASSRQQLLGLSERLVVLRGLRVFRLKDYNYAVGQGVKEEMHEWLSELLPGCMVWLQIG